LALGGLPHVVVVALALFARREVWVFQRSLGGGPARGSVAGVRFADDVALPGFGVHTDPAAVCARYRRARVWWGGRRLSPAVDRRLPIQQRRSIPTHSPHKPAGYGPAPCF